MHTSFSQNEYKFTYYYTIYPHVFVDALSLDYKIRNGSEKGQKHFFEV